MKAKPKAKCKTVTRSHKSKEPIRIEASIFLTCSECGWEAKISVKGGTIKAQWPPEILAGHEAQLKGWHYYDVYRGHVLCPKCAKGK